MENKVINKEKKKFSNGPIMNSFYSSLKSSREESDYIKRFSDFVQKMDKTNLFSYTTENNSK